MYTFTPISKYIFIKAIIIFKKKKKKKII